MQAPCYQFLSCARLTEDQYINICISQIKYGLSQSHNGRRDTNYSTLDLITQISRPFPEHPILQNQGTFL